MKLLPHLASVLRVVLIAVVAMVSMSVLALPANATGVAASAPTTTRVAEAAVTLPTSWGDCRRLSGIAGTPFQKVRAALSIPGCVGTAGNGSADAICWTSRQWWGGGARWVVLMITNGRYDRC